MKTLYESTGRTLPEVPEFEVASLYEYMKLHELKNSEPTNTNAHYPQHTPITNAQTEVILTPVVQIPTLADQMIGRYKNELAQKEPPSLADKMTSQPRVELPKEKPLSLADQMIGRYKSELAAVAAPKTSGINNARTPHVTDSKSSSLHSKSIATRELQRYRPQEGTPKQKLGRKVLAFVGLATIASMGPSYLPVNDTTPKKVAPISQESTVTTQMPETTTTTEAEAPKPVEFMVGIGETIGVLDIPSICNDNIEVIAYSDVESDLIGKGSATIDRKIPDPTPAPEQCERIDEMGENFLSRADRVRSSATSAENPEGHVDFWQPTAGMQLSSEHKTPDGKYNLPTTPYPGAPGNAVIAGHGSTYNAAFADLGAVKQGDLAYFNRADGWSFTYEAVAMEVLSPETLAPFMNYTHPDSESTLTLYMCSDANGNTGSSKNRYVVRLVLRSAIQK